MAKPMEGRSVVVFGASGALGRAVVAHMAEAGAEVVAVDARVSETSSAPEARTRVALDVLDESAVASLFVDLETAPWAVVNVVGGYTPAQAVADLDLALLRQQLELNLITAATITKHAVRAMVRSGRGGRIVHTASRVAFQNGRDGFSYSVSKQGVVRLVEAAAAELVDEAITVNCIVPSIIDTPVNRAAMPNADFARWPKPEELAAVVALLVSDQAALVSGAAIPVYGRA